MRKLFTVKSSYVVDEKFLTTIFSYSNFIVLTILYSMCIILFQYCIAIRCISHKHIHMLTRDYKCFPRHTQKRLHIKLSSAMGQARTRLPLVSALIKLPCVSKHRALKEQFLPFALPPDVAFNLSMLVIIWAKTILPFSLEGIL